MRNKKKTSGLSYREWEHDIHHLPLNAKRMKMRHDTYVFNLLYESFHFRETRQPLHHLVEAGQTMSLRYIHFLASVQSFQLFSSVLINLFIIYRLLIFSPHLIEFYYIHLGIIKLLVIPLERKRNLEKMFPSSRIIINSIFEERSNTWYIYIHIKWSRGAKKSNQTYSSILAFGLHRLIQAHQQKHSLNPGRVPVPFK